MILNFMQWLDDYLGSSYYSEVAHRMKFTASNENALFSPSMPTFPMFHVNLMDRGTNSSIHFAKNYLT